VSPAHGVLGSMSTRTVPRLVPAGDQRLEALGPIFGWALTGLTFSKAAYALLIVLPIGALFLFVAGLIAAADLEVALPIAAALSVLVLVPSWRFHRSARGRAEADENDQNGDLPRARLSFSPTTRVLAFIDVLVAVLVVWLMVGVLFALATSVTDSGSLAASSPEQRAAASSPEQRAAAEAEAPSSLADAIKNAAEEQGLPENPQRQGRDAPGSARAQAEQDRQGKGEHAQGRVEEHRDQQRRIDRASALYLWHLFDALPFVKATDTLNWKEPVARYSGVTGTLLLLYKTLVLLPGVLAARHAWQYLNGPRTED